jgi:hypothetical protein
MNMSKDKFNKHVPIDHEDLPMVIDQKVRQMISSLPKNFNATAIYSAAEGMRRNPTMLSSFMASLRSVFKTNQEIKILNAMERQIQAVASGLETQTRLKALEREYLLAVANLNTINDDLEIQSLEKEDKKEELRLRIAQKRHARLNLKDDSSPEKEKTAEDIQAEKLAGIRKQQKFKAEENAVKKFGEFYTRREIEKECERLKQAILKGRTLENLSEQEKQEIEDLEDARDYALDHL